MLKQFITWEWRNFRNGEAKFYVEEMKDFNKSNELSFINNKKKI